MKVVCDIEANSLGNPTKIWCIVCKDIDTGITYTFNDWEGMEYASFKTFAKDVRLWIGHNFLGYDYPVLNKLLGFSLDDVSRVSIDTLIVSKLVDYSRKQGHSVEAYGIEFGLEKIKFNDFTKWSQELEDYCRRDVDVTHKIYLRHRRIVDDPSWHPSLYLEQDFQSVVNRLHNNGFSFNTKRASSLLTKVEGDLAELDEKILVSFPPKLKLIREITPKETKHGTLSRTDFRFIKDGDLSDYNGGAFSRCSWECFNPSSHRQIVEVLSKSGWRPTDKTTTHIETEREIGRLKYTRSPSKELDLKTLSDKLLRLKETGWKVNENNLTTLPTSAPAPARTLAKRILLESRRRTLTEWLGLVNPQTERIHGKFQGIGAWTHRMAHQQPNTANIPNEHKEDGSKKLLGKELRSLWQAPKNRLLVGVDAEGIQLRIFAHYVDNKELTEALTKGSKEDKSDPHSLNQSVLGSTCKTRQAAKRFLYAMFLGGGPVKLSQILECSREEVDTSIKKFLNRYPGFEAMRASAFPKDAARGYFIGLDGRKVRIPDDTESGRKHLCMSGYLQNGESIIIKAATLKALEKTSKLENVVLVNIVHDEYVIEAPNNVVLCEQIRDAYCQSIEEVGVDLKLKCPLKGDGNIGLNWSEIH